jgi:hypothetical protein
LKELEQYFARQISVYHKTIHSTLGMPLLTAWERDWVINGAPLHAYLAKRGGWPLL